MKIVESLRFVLANQVVNCIETFVDWANSDKENENEKKSQREERETRKRARAKKESEKRKERDGNVKHGLPQQHT